ncbi:uncharacterized protein LOC144450892 [Glandiceps talaboti]
MSNRFKSHGIIHHALLTSILQNLSVDYVDVLVALLKEYNFIVLIEKSPSNNEEYFVPDARPLYLRPTEFLFCPRNPHQTFYFDFGFFKPDIIHRKLMTRCLEVCQYFRIYRNVGTFVIDGQFSCTIEVVDHLLEQRLIKVSIEPVNDTNPFYFLAELFGYVEEHRTSQLHNLRYTCGILCDLQPPSPHDIYLHEKMYHILPLASPHMGIEFPIWKIGSEVIKHCGGSKQIIYLK